MKTQVVTIKQTVTIPASPKEVYNAFVDPKIHSEFTEAKATGKPVVGGKFTAWDGYIQAKFKELEQDKRIVQEWMTVDWEEGYGPSTLELCFKAVPAGTEITMVHSDVPKAQEEELADGWNESYWNPLKEYFAKKKK
jgi:activator of HSP90 ATPase